MTTKLYNDDCFNVLKTLPNKSIDIFICDLPYSSKNFGKCTTCKWDKTINLDKLWIEFKRLRKHKKTPFFFFCNVKHGYDLISSNPKIFRYEICWIKSSPTGFLNARRMPLRKTEYIYVFYERLPFYDLSSHKHKFFKERKEVKKGNHIYGNSKKSVINNYEPKLPTNVIEENKKMCKYEENIYMKKGRKNLIKVPLDKKYHAVRYEPKLPNNILEIKSQKGKHQTQKPVDIYKWILKYYSKKGWNCLDPTMGSGSCGVACKELGVNFIGIEDSAKIYNIALERIKST